MYGTNRYDRNYGNYRKQWTDRPDRTFGYNWYDGSDGNDGTLGSSGTCRT
jgi:hypothetical protein